MSKALSGSLATLVFFYLIGKLDLLNEIKITASF